MILLSGGGYFIATKSSAVLVRSLIGGSFENNAMKLEKCCFTAMIRRFWRYCKMGEYTEAVLTYLYET